MSDSSSEKAAIMRAFMKGGRDVEKSAAILDLEFKKNPDAFPGIRADMQEMLWNKCDAERERVIQEMPHLADDPEGVAAEVVRRFKERFKVK